MTRRPDWPERLDAFLEERRDRMFAWGEHDCVLAAADWVLQATGRDPIEGWRGRWSNAAEAARMIAKAGGIEAAVTVRLGLPLDAVAQAQRGDIALVEHDGRKTLGIVTDSGLACPGENGMVILPINAAGYAWRV